MPTFALNFSRPGGQIVAQYYNFVRLGYEGYREVHQASYTISKHIATELEKMGIFDIIHSGKGGIPAVSWSLKPGKDYTLFDISDKIRSRGWKIAAYSMPANREELVVMRILVRNGFTLDLAEFVIKDIKSVVATLECGRAEPTKTFAH